MVVSRTYDSLKSRFVKRFKLKMNQFSRGRCPGLYQKGGFMSIFAECPTCLEMYLLS